MKTDSPRRRRPLAWSVAMLDELEGAGIEDRQEQARAMGVSLPQIDRLRKALREDHGVGTYPLRRGTRTQASAATRPAAKTAGALHPQPLSRAGRAARAAASTGPAGDLVQLGVRVPATIAERLRRHAGRSGLSAALLAAVALHDWLAAHGVPGPSPLTKREREALGL